MADCQGQVKGHNPQDMETHLPEKSLANLEIEPQIPLWLPNQVATYIASNLSFHDTIKCIVKGNGKQSP